MFFKYVVVILTFEHLNELLLACLTCKHIDKVFVALVIIKRRFFFYNILFECITHIRAILIKMKSIKGYGYIVAL